MQQAHVSALEAKHAGLEARINEETQRPMPDTATLNRLKKETFAQFELPGRLQRGPLRPVSARSLRQHLSAL